MDLYLSALLGKGGWFWLRAWVLVFDWGGGVGGGGSQTYGFTIGAFRGPIAVVGRLFRIHCFG